MPFLDWYMIGVSRIFVSGYWDHRHQGAGIRRLQVFERDGGMGHVPVVIKCMIIQGKTMYLYYLDQEPILHSVVDTYLYRYLLLRIDRAQID
jgi:hypothetical protein